MKLRDMLRAQFVRRWIIVPMSREQSMAEHSFNVMMIARNLANRLEIGDIDIMKAAIVHDLDEVHTGDLPTPIKEKAKENGVDLNKLYEKVTGRRLNILEEDVIKAADLIESVYYADQFAIGALGRQVKFKLDDRLAKLIDWHKVNGQSDLATAMENLCDDLFMVELDI